MDGKHIFKIRILVHQTNSIIFISKFMLIYKLNCRDAMGIKLIVNFGNILFGMTLAVHDMIALLRASFV